MVVKIPRPAVGGKSQQISSYAPGENQQWNLKHLTNTETISNFNTLLSICDPIFRFLSEITIMVKLSNIDKVAIRQEIVSILEKVHFQLKSQIEDAEIVKMSSVLLSVFIDEVMMQRFQDSLLWNQLGVLAVEYHGISNGGEALFDNLETAFLQPDRFEELLVLYYYAFTLGLKGKELYSDSNVYIETLRARILSMLSRLQPGLSSTPSIDSHGQTTSFKSRKLKKPLYILVLFLSLLCIVIVSRQILSVVLNAKSRPVLNQISHFYDHFHPDQFASEHDIQYAVLKKMLHTEINLGVVDLNMTPDAVEIVLPSASLFKSGDADININAFPVINKIAKALEQTTGMIVVEGHTDNQPLHSSDFNSNWALSLARANKVVQQLDAFGHLDKRLVPEGKGDSMPIVGNVTAHDRAKNRRVVIKLIRNA